MLNREHALRVVRLHSDDIASTGTLELRWERERKPTYGVRYRTKCPVTGTIRQHRLTIGDDPELHDLVRSAITARVRQSIEAKAAKALEIERRNRARTLEKELMVPIAGSRRYRQGVRKVFRKFCNATLDTAYKAFIEAMDDRKLRRRNSGRPRKARLW